MTIEISHLAAGSAYGPDATNVPLSEGEGSETADDFYNQYATRKKCGKLSDDQDMAPRWVFERGRLIYLDEPREERFISAWKKTWQQI